MVIIVAHYEGEYSSNRGKIMETVHAREAAERLGVSYQTVLRWIEKGKLEAERGTKEWKVPTSEIERVSSIPQEELQEAADAERAVEWLRDRLSTRWLHGLSQVRDAAERYIAAADDFDAVANGSETALLARHDNLESQLADLEGAVQRVRQIADLMHRTKELEADARRQAIDAGREAEILDTEGGE